jgi:hypothetical protein
LPLTETLVLTGLPTSAIRRLLVRQLVTVRAKSTIVEINTPVTLFGTVSTNEAGR